MERQQVNAKGKAGSTGRVSQAKPLDRYLDGVVVNSGLGLSWYGIVWYGTIWYGMVPTFLLVSTVWHHRYMRRRAPLFVLIVQFDCSNSIML